MSGYQPQSRDTSIEADKLMFELYRRAGAVERVRIAIDLGLARDEICRAGLRARHPHADERAIELRLASLKYGPELIRRAFGWDPDAER